MHVCPDIVYVCAIVVTLNACKCVHTCVCVPVWTQCPACVAIEWSYGLCPASILVLLLASECMAAPAGSGTITPFPLPHPKPPLLSLGVTMPLFGSTHHPETRRPLGKNWPGCGCHTATGTQRSWGGQREGRKKKGREYEKKGISSWEYGERKCVLDKWVMWSVLSHQLWFTHTGNEEIMVEGETRLKLWKYSTASLRNHPPLLF